MGDDQDQNIAKPLLRYGKLLSVGWLALIFTYGFLKYPAVREMPMNEMGDFLAGAFAPLAFGWLVLAVLLQQQELANSRSVLSLQAKELAASVEAIQRQTDEIAQAEAHRLVANQHNELGERIRVLAIGLAAISRTMHVECYGTDGKIVYRTGFMSPEEDIAGLTGRDRFEEAILMAAEMFNRVHFQMNVSVGDGQATKCKYMRKYAFATWLQALTDTLNWIEACDNQIVNLTVQTLKLKQLASDAEYVHNISVELSASDGI